MAEQDGGIVGYAHGTLTLGPPPLLPRTSGTVTDVAVRDDARRRGLGRGLMEALVARLAAEGATELKLNVAVGKESAIALYKSMGFEPLTWLMRKVLE